MRRWVMPLALVVALAPVAAAGCGSDATGVDVCKKIEDARCNAAAKCSNISLTPPYYTSGSATDACVRFYDTACLHGLAGAAPGPGELDACVGLIQKGNCAVLAAPWKFADCAWLVPSSTPEAGTDATDASDAGDGSDAAEAEAEASGD